ncbi:MAG: tetraacyldisaccharide 4'-kinase [Proteobacteria bacterium]|nr:tetraacyldisaccharide 4'-kinase [Pseudomonadota bacterium]
MRAPEFWQQKDYTAKLAVAALSPVGWIYGATVAWKHANAKPYRPRAKVLCIGNLTAGGSGKTPIAIAVARALVARGLKPAILSRGYGGRMHGPAYIDVARDSAAETGDEPLLLAAAAPVIVARDRKAGAELADKNGTDVIVMDDGYQNFALQKDLSLVVVDAAAGFGNRRILPAGPLREPVPQGLARADAVVLLGNGSPSLAGFFGPVLRAQLTPVDVLNLAGKRVLAFAGIGRPQKFFETLRALGAEIVEARAYADHHAYAASEIARLKARARGTHSMLVTTEKDYVRLTSQDRDDIRFLPVRAAFENQSELERLLDRVAGPR